MEHKILSALRQNPRVTLAELATELGLSKDVIRYRTNRLQKRGILQRVGTYKGHWEVIE
ncbi:MAG: winged helix-turn-helix domain-containing protein [Burkholderiaceae bacterium]|nr:winged helix-turn-helix domain-containing protein [Burkholderiaceae bacterium]